MVADLQNRINILIYACIILDRSASRSTHMDQRNCLLENIHQEIYTKLGVRETVNRQLWIQVLLWQCSWQLCVNFAFVLTPKSAVKSSRQTWRLFFTLINSLVWSDTEYGTNNKRKLFWFWFQREQRRSTFLSINYYRSNKKESSRRHNKDNFLNSMTKFRQSTLPMERVIGLKWVL